MVAPPWAPSSCDISGFNKEGLPFSIEYEHIHVHIHMCTCMFYLLYPSLQVVKKLQGAAAGSATWVTNIGNEHGEVLM